MKFTLILIVLIFFIISFLYLFFLTEITGSASTAIGESNFSVSISVHYNTLNVSPTLFMLLAPPGNTTGDTFDVIAEFPGNTGLNVTLNKSGDIADWITLEVDVVNLTPGEIQPVDFNVTPPISQADGIYYGWINTTSSDGQKKDINVTVNISTYVSRINVSVNNTIGNPVEAATVFIWDMIPILRDSGSTNSQGLFLSHWLDPGNYTVEVVKDGYETVKQNVTVYTTNITQVFITLQPIAAPRLDVSPSSISESVLVGESVTRILTVMNIGDMDLVNVTLNSSQSWISFSTQLIPLLIPGNYTYIYAYLGPLSSPGIYYGSIFVNSSNNGNKTIPVVLQVNPPPSPPGFGGGGGGLLKANLSITQYPEIVTAKQGEVEFFAITVNNTGEVRLNTSLQILGIDSSWYSVDPLYADLLIGKGQVFIIKLNIPKDVEPQDIPIVFKAFSGFITDVKPALLSIGTVGAENIRIKDIKISRLIRGQKGQINITLENLVAKPINVTADLYFPSSFLVDKDVKSEIVEAHSEKTIIFEATPQASGTYNIIMTFYYGGREIIKNVPVNVYDYEALLGTFSLLLALCLILFVIVLVRRREKEEKRTRRRYFLKRSLR